jgi:hypothetical protein
MAVTHPAQTHAPAERSAGKSVRLHYLDWLRVLAILARPARFHKPGRSTRLYYPNQGHQIPEGLYYSESMIRYNQT